MAVSWLPLVLVFGGLTFDLVQAREPIAFPATEHESAVRKFAEFEMAVRLGNMTSEQLEQRVCDFNWCVGRPPNAPIDNVSIEAVIALLDRVFDGAGSNKIIRERVRVYCRVMERRHLRAYLPQEIQLAYDSFQAAVNDGRMNVDELAVRVELFNWSLGRPADAAIGELSLEEAFRLLDHAYKVNSTELSTIRNDSFCRSIGLAVPSE